ncbi:hypothetical protein IHE45_10G019300 [Dioscorea alata]|uniref:Uncharacterized protein n=1 Tax=Dioscorea alata TaxID=55571 RepID=A0ACB7V9N6_DIOAL|nr:hypothetical protein IHE45_10G019300 [Dioscorea alata]
MAGDSFLTFISSKSQSVPLSTCQINNNNHKQRNYIWWAFSEQEEG